MTRTMTIAKSFTFDAAHCLPLLPEGHKCRRMHGHTYQVTVQLFGSPDPATGMLIDFDDIAKIWAPLHVQLDHNVLNEVKGLEMPTTENLLLWILDHLEDSFRAHPRISHLTIRVGESTTTWAERDISINTHLREQL
jgi:6-pyruvoyltetrahydropterin/6-carboxytetrahydropterin synthase